MTVLFYYTGFDRQIKRLNHIGEQERKKYKKKMLVSEWKLSNENYHNIAEQWKIEVQFSNCGIR